MKTYKFVKSFRKGEEDGVHASTWTYADGYTIYVLDDDKKVCSGGWWIWDGGFINHDLELVQTLARTIPNEVYTKDLLTNHSVAVKIRAEGWR